MFHLRVDPRRLSKRQRNQTPLLGVPRFLQDLPSIPECPPEDMSFLAVPSIPMRKISQRFTGKNAELDAFLSSDVDAELELSFASNMSLHSPPRLGADTTAELSIDEVPMDISPAPVKLASAPKGRPRAHTSAGTTRLFGKDVSNDSLDVPPKSSIASKNLKRPALPSLWTQDANDISTTDQSIEMPSSDAMDIDTSFMSNAVHSPSPPPPASAAPTITQFSIRSSQAPPLSAASTVTSFNKLFYDSASPPRDSRGRHSGESSREQPYHKKRRSLSPHEELPSSPGVPSSSPSVLKLERIVGQQGARKQSQHASTLGVNEHNKRPRRPILSAMVPPVDAFDGPFSAMPALENKENRTASAEKDFQKEKDRDVAGQRHHVLPPVRRAFSAMVPSAVLDASMTSEGDSWEAGADPSSPAVQYARRQQVKTTRRYDGTEDSRGQSVSTGPLKRDGEVIRTLRRSEDKGDRSGERGINSIRAQQQQQQPSAVPMERDTPRSKYLNAGGSGLGGFGDNEAMGKILPCHRVREDGLMRIKSKTLDDLLDGKYDSRIASYHIVDCRFDYEYNGGHIPGAININTTAGVEEYFLGSGAPKPRPSTSGDAHKKTIVVFHCEFSCKRAPTLQVAKHLRAKDRAMNNHVYPKIHFPDVYILEGGYCQYFQDSGDRCQPRAYVRMDDPHYAASRREDLDQFRKAKFGRTKSYAYGEMGTKGGLGATLAAQPKRSSAPSSTSGGAAATLFAPANNTRSSRRTNGMLQTLEEHPSMDHQSDEDTDIGDSPCPPPSKGVQFKGKKMGRAPLTRAETYGPSKIAIGY